ncbi:MAG TPA: class II fructose-bisphosphate aldolase [Anaerolineales bacterium]
MSELNELLSAIGNSVMVEGVTVKVKDAAKLRANVGKLVEFSAVRSGDIQGWARYIVRGAALDLGIIPSSIHELYMARGRGEAPLTFTTPALNLRVLSYHAGRAVFRTANKMNGGAFIFEIARSEIGYTAQRPAEYSTNILAAAIAEGWTGPVFIQGDHFQMSSKKYASDAQGEINAVKDLAREAISAGFFNIDIDASTLVDITKPSVPEQQETNFSLSSQVAGFIRGLEPKGVTISIGGEIGEVGGHNSTEEELRAFMDGFNAGLGKGVPGKPGLSKISIQTGTSHGGTVLPDGTLAKVSIDFDTLRELSRVARRDYHLGGTVQHGASTLPEDAFHKFVENEAIEVHLATNFMTMFYESIPATLRGEMYAWLDKNSAAERKPDMTDEQFYYKTRKNALGAFKPQMYALPSSELDKLGAAWQAQFEKLFNLLGVKDTRQYVEKFVKPVAVAPEMKFYLGKEVSEAMADDLQD